LKNHDYFDTSEDEEDGDEEYHDIKGKVCGVWGWIQPDLVGVGVQGEGRMKKIENPGKSLNWKKIPGLESP
jgi:hypothetical protein